MDIQSYIKDTFPVGTEFDVLKRELKSAPLYLEVRENEDLFTLMFSDKSPKEHPAVRQSVGPVFDKSENLLRGYALGRTEELVIDCGNPALLEESLDSVDLDTDKVIQYVEGIKLTVYFYAEQWRVSTTRVIDAFNGFWSSSKSFGTMFMEACEKLYPEMHTQLSENIREGPLSGLNSYVFILSTPDHKFIQDVFNPSLIHASSFDLERKVYVSDDIGVPKQNQVTFSSVDALKQKLLSSPPSHAGYIIEGKSRLRLVTKAYKDIQALRGNNPNPFRHYLEVRQINSVLNDLLYYYPEFQGIMAYTEMKIHELSSIVYKFYTAFFIRRIERPRLDKTLFVTLMQIHSEYQRTGIKRTQRLVYEHISCMPPGLLYGLLTNTDYNPLRPAISAADGN